MDDLEDEMFELPAGYGLEQTTGGSEATAPAPAAQAPQAATMLCCECGVLIAPNPSAMCANCIRSRVDITEGIPKQGVIYFCRGCDRYLQPPNQWIVADLESRELLSLCLKRLKGLSKVRMVDAGFIWTEPHSRRVKVKITIQKEVIGGAILQQVFVVEFVVNHQMCEDCHRREAKDTWTAVLQLRQKVKHKKTFFYLEQLIIKHRAQRDCVNITARPDGVDFYFASRTHAKQLVEFLRARTPLRVKTSERLISADIQNATANFKHSFSTEIAPICRDDIVCLHPGLAKKLGGISPILLCDAVGSLLHFMDPLSLQVCEVSSENYWRKPFNSICSHKGHTEYVVMDIEAVRDKSGQPVVFGKNALAEVTVARVRDLGSNDTQFTTRTHLGNILQAGDNVWGFDIQSGNINDEHANRLNLSDLPDVILVKKSYSDKRKHRRRKWKLKNITKPAEGNKKKEIEQAEQDYEHFLRDLEEDPDLRSTVNIYKDAEYAPSSTTPSEVDDEELRISLEEMLDEFDELDVGGGDADAEKEVSSPKRIRVSEGGGSAAPSDT